MVVLINIEIACTEHSTISISNVFVSIQTEVRFCHTKSKAKPYFLHFSLDGIFRKDLNFYRTYYICNIIMKQQSLHTSKIALCPGRDVVGIMETFFKERALLYINFKQLYE